MRTFPVFFQINPNNFSVKQIFDDVSQGVTDLTRHLHNLEINFESAHGEGSPFQLPSPPRGIGSPGLSARLERRRLQQGGAGASPGKTSHFALHLAIYSCKISDFRAAAEQRRN